MYEHINSKTARITDNMEVLHDKYITYTATDTSGRYIIWKAEKLYTASQYSNLLKFQQTKLDVF